MRPRTGRTVQERLRCESDTPQLDALRQQFNGLMGRDAERALRAVRTRTELFPADRDGWATRVSFEKFMLGEAHFDSTLTSQRERFLSLDRALQGQPNVAPELMAGMGDYGVQISTPEYPEIGAAARRWRDRLAQRAECSEAQAFEMISCDNSRSTDDSTKAQAAASGGARSRAGYGNRSPTPLNNYAAPTYNAFDKRGARRFDGISPTDARAQAVTPAAIDTR